MQKLVDWLNINFGVGFREMKKKKLMRGVLVEKVQINLFVTVLIKKQKKHPLNLIVKIPKKYIFADVRKVKTHHFVIVLINH